MARHVLKFGGSSTADPKKLYSTARRIAAEYQAGHEVIALLPGQKTCAQALLAKARQIDPNCQGQDLNALLAVAGNCAVCLCALALKRLGFPVIHPDIGQKELLVGKLPAFKKRSIEQGLKQGNILLLPWIAEVSFGEEGLSSPSELAAVTLAAFLKADFCYIFTEDRTTQSLSPHRIDFPKEYGVAVKTLPFLPEKRDLPV